MADEVNYVEEEFGPMLAFTQRVAAENCYPNLCAALEIIPQILSGHYGKLERRGSDDGRLLASFHHSLSVCRMLLDLHLPYSKEEEDIMLAAAVCHVLPEFFYMESVKWELTEICDAAVFDMVNLITSEENDRHYFRRIRENKMALLIILADQSHLCELLYEFSSWDVKNIIYETRNDYMPLCIYAKEHYPEVLGQVSVLMEKMRNHTIGAEMLLHHYEVRETELKAEILAMQEENAALRQRIQALRNEDQREQEQ